MSVVLEKALHKYVWFGIIFLSVSQLLKPVIDALSLIKSGTGIEWGFVGFIDAIPMMVIGLIVADTIRPINLLRHWTGKSLIGLTIFLVLFSAVASLSLYFQSSQFFSNQLDFSKAERMVIKQKLLPFTIVSKSLLYVLICLVGFFKKPVRHVSLEEVFD